MLLMSRGWSVLIVPQSKWLSFCGDTVQQHAYLRQLLFRHVDINCGKQDDTKAAGKSADNSNASTDDEEAFEAIGNYAAN